MSTQCPFKNSSKPPCDYQQHPHDSDTMFCKVCRDSYHVNEVRSFPQMVSWALALVLTIIVIAVLPEKPKSSVPAAPDSSEVHSNANLA